MTIANNADNRNGIFTNTATEPYARKRVIRMEDPEDGVSNLTNGQTHHPSPSKKQKLRDDRRLLVEQQRRDLPIFSGRDQLIEQVKQNDTIVLLGETGSGKSTQIPQYIHDSGLSQGGTIAVTQPRRIAATSLASRVAHESNSSLGKEVGYSVRFDDRSLPTTNIKYVTDGYLVRELLSDPLLMKYSCIIIDEAHERGLNTDILLAKLKWIQKERRDPSESSSTFEARPLKVIIMSATLDAEKFSQFYDNAKIIYVKGRQHPVKIYHSSAPQQNYLDAAMTAFFQIHIGDIPGDVLIFLPGQEDIESLSNSIGALAKRLPNQHMRVVVHQMYAAMANHNRVFQPAVDGSRKCILATNVAETSITIPGVRFVIDTGVHKEKRYKQIPGGRDVATLLTVNVSKSSAMQRAGRAGREGPGYCYRLYTEEAFIEMDQTSLPEILRCDLASAVLELKCIGQNLEDLEFLDTPEANALHSALKELFLLGAIDKSKNITDIGRAMARFPLEPNLSRTLLAAGDKKCTSEVIDIISILAANSQLFLDVTDQREAAGEARLKFKHPSGDHLTILNVVRTYDSICSSTDRKEDRKEWCQQHFLSQKVLTEAQQIREQLQKTCASSGLDPNLTQKDAEDPILQSFLIGFFANTALLQPDGSFRQMIGHSAVKIHPSSTLHDKKAPAIMYHELTETSHTYARCVSAVSSGLKEIHGIQL